MSKKYIDEDNLQIAMTEYKDLHEDKIVKTQYDDTVGIVSKVYDNEQGNGEQV